MQFPSEPSECVCTQHILRECSAFVASAMNPPSCDNGPIGNGSVHVKLELTYNIAVCTVSVTYNIYTYRKIGPLSQPGRLAPIINNMASILHSEHGEEA